MKRTRLIFASGLSAVLMSAAGGEPAAKPVIIESTQQQSRTVQVDERDVVQVNTRLRFTTLILLPKFEAVLDVFCGDAKEWQIDSFKGTNLVSAKPTKSLQQTNMNVVTESGRVYSFLLTEGPNGTNPDMKVFVEWNGPPIEANAKPRFVPASALEDYRAQVDLARMQATEAKKAAAEELATKTAQLNAEVSKLKSTAPHEMRFDYKYVDQPGFNVAAMWTDGKFSFIKAKPQELMSLYEYKDDRLNLVDFRFENDLYVVNKVLDRGVLSIGKRKLHFERKGS